MLASAARSSTPLQTTANEIIIEGPVKGGKKKREKLLTGASHGGFLRVVSTKKRKRFLVNDLTRSNERKVNSFRRHAFRV